MARVTSVVLQTNQSSIPSDLEALGPVYINRLRLVMLGFFVVVIGSSWKFSPLFQFKAFLVGFCLLSICFLMQEWQTKKNPLSIWQPRVFVIFDLTSLFITTLILMSNSQNEAATHLKNQGLFVLYFFFLSEAAFLLSKPFLLFATFYVASLLLLLTCYAHFVMDVEFIESSAVQAMLGKQALSSEIRKICYLVGFGFVLSAILTLLTTLRDRVQEKLIQTEAARKDADLNQKALLNLGKVLADSITSINQSMSAFNDQTQIQSASLEEISASVEEFSSSLLVSSEHVKGQYRRIAAIDRESEALLTLIANISSGAEFISESMDSYSLISAESARSISELDILLSQVTVAFQRVGDINRIMSEVADRSHLLALNASIEAARAGEHGRGFSVVAQEVAKLADHSKQNASSIQQIIEQNAVLIMQGSRLAGGVSLKVNGFQKDFQSLNVKTQDLLSHIRDQKRININVVKALSEIKQLSIEIEANSIEQTQNAMQVAETIGQLDGAVSSLAKNAETIRETLMQLEIQSNGLQQHPQQNLRIASMNSSDEGKSLHN